MIVQSLRRMTQAGVIAILAAIPLLSLYAHYRSARSIDDPALMAGLRGEAITQHIHPFVESLDDPQGFLDSNKGTLWSMRLFGIDITDPLAAIEMTFATKSVYWPLILTAAIPVILTIILGKVFCSWICPAYVLFEVTGKLRRLLRFAEIQPGKLRFSHSNKYLFLFVGLGAALIAAAPLFALIYPPAVVSRAIHAWVFGTALMGMLILLGLIVAFELFVSPRWWCRTMCPGGALYGLLGWFRPVRIKLKSELCTACQECIPVCEAGINPITQSESIECDNCCACVRHCDDRALIYTIGLPIRSSSKQSRPSPQRAGRAAALLVLLMAPLVHSSPAWGHHILGLPHYSYKENYPQRPTLEYPATTGPYSVLLTSYPGIPVPGEPANLAFYIKNKTAREVYGMPITVRTLQTSTFGDNVTIMPPTTREPFDNEYKFHVTFPDDGEYIVELTLEVEGKTEIIPFLMVVGEPTATASIAVFSSFGMIILFVVLRAAQKKRARKNAQDINTHSQGACAATVKLHVLAEPVCGSHESQ